MVRFPWIRQCKRIQKNLKFHVYAGMNSYLDMPWLEESFRGYEITNAPWDAVHHFNLHPWIISFYVQDITVYNFKH